VELVLVRHAEPASGRESSGLSEVGRTQARLLAIALACETWDALYTSGSPPACETGDLLADAAALKPKSEPKLGNEGGARPEAAVVAVRSIAALHPGRRVLVVTDGASINANVAALWGVSWLPQHEPSHTGVTRLLVSSGGATSVRSLNETVHLRVAEQLADIAKKA
jgi:broad specificity phosphatase PhoE